MGSTIATVPHQGGKLLVNGATGTGSAPSHYNDGSLYEAMGYKHYTFQVKGITSATVTLYATLDPAAAKNFQSNLGGVSNPAVNWSALTTITTDGFYELTGPLVGLAAAVTTYSSGTISVWAYACP